jgi:hypothetical protein
MFPHLFLPKNVSIFQYIGCHLVMVSSPNLILIDVVQFFLLYISACEKDKILNFFLNMRDGKLRKFCGNRPQLQNKKVFEIFFIILNMMGSSTIMKVVPFANEVGHQNKSVSIGSDIFCRAFHGASLKRIQDFTIYLCRDMCEIKKCCKHFDTPCIILIDFEKFIITFSCLYFYYSKGQM